MTNTTKTTDNQSTTLALEKTKANYSNERTLLAYIRTSASVLVLAVGLIKFFEDPLTRFLGFGTLGVGLIILVFGTYRYKQEKSRIKRT
jgi:putative membrane protein